MQEMALIMGSVNPKVLSFSVQSHLTIIAPVNLQFSDVMDSSSSKGTKFVVPDALAFYISMPKK